MNLVGILLALIVVATHLIGFMSLALSFLSIPIAIVIIVFMTIKKDSQKLSQARE